MALDPSIITNGVPQNNLMAQISQASQAKNLLLQNQSNQAELVGRQAIGQAIANHTNNLTGAVDYDGARAELAQNPNASFVLPQFDQMSLANQTAQQGLSSATSTAQQGQVDAHRAALGLITNGLQRALQDPTITDKALHSYGADIYSDQTLSPQLQGAMVDDFSKFMAGLPPEADQDGRRKYIQGFAAQALTAQQAFEQNNPTPQAVNTGGQTQFVASSGLVAPHTVGQPLQNTMTQGESVTPAYTQYNQATGQNEIVTKADAAQAAATGQPAKGIVTSPSAGDLAAQTTEGTGNAQQALALQNRAGQVPQNKALLDNMRGELQNFKTGSTSEWQQSAERFANSVSPIGALFDPSKIASQEDFNKQAVQLAQSQFQALGGTGTDAKLNSTMHTSPSTALSNMGNNQIMALLEGNEDAIKVQNQAWQNYKQQNGADSYGQFQAKFSNVFDPRVFQYQYLQPSEQQAMLKAMSKMELTQFDAHMNVAKKAGWVQ